MKKKKYIKKQFRGIRGISPVVSTIILIMIVLIIAILIILWFRVFFKEIVLKEVGGDSKRIEEFCNNLELKAFSNADASFGISNEGNIPIKAIVLKTSTEDGSSQTRTINDPINPGNSLTIKKESGNGNELKTDYSNIKIIPILLGKKKGDVVQAVTCPEKNSIIIK